MELLGNTEHSGNVGSLHSMIRLACLTDFFNLGEVFLDLWPSFVKDLVTKLLGGCPLKRIHCLEGLENDLEVSRENCDSEQTRNCIGETGDLRFITWSLHSSILEELFDVVGERAQSLVLVNGLVPQTQSLYFLQLCTQSL